MYNIHMNREARSIKQKLCVIVILNILEISGFGYLICTNAFGRIRDNIERKSDNATSTISNKNDSNTSNTTSIITTSETSTDSNETVINVDYMSDDSLYKLVNKDNSVEQSYVPSLSVPNVEMNNTQYVRSDIVYDLESMFEAAKENSIDLYLISGYRSYQQQVSLWYTYIDEYGVDYTDMLDSHPGKSEHQLGLAVDLGIVSHACELNTCFSNSDAYQWLKNNAYKYGFIERYPSDKVEKTGIVYSPWHYRYIGKEMAEKYYKSGLSYEEFISSLK